MFTKMSSSHYISSKKGLNYAKKRKLTTDSLERAATILRKGWERGGKRSNGALVNESLV